MNSSTKPQYAEIEYPFPLEEPPVIYCPLCGNPTYELNDRGEFKVNPCQHLAFIFLGDPSTFAYKSKDFEYRITGKDLKDLSFENFKEFIESLGYDNKFLTLEVTHRGMGNRRIWYTDNYGFDYALYQ
jgi:hypothetical protein